MHDDADSIDPGWPREVPQFQDGTLDQLLHRVNEKRKETTVFPPAPAVLRAFKLVPFDAVKVVILGQDPYHTPGMADGLAFSVPNGQRTPPSLRNIFKEIRNDVYNGDQSIVFRSDLTRWARQGVLLLNTVLSVESGVARSHRKLGWHRFTDIVITSLNARRRHLVFMLWGNDARKKATLINPDNHLVLEAPHPSPLARGGFFECRHFSQANNYLAQVQGAAPIEW